jgi:hypothetical protein
MGVRVGREQGLQDAPQRIGDAEIRGGTVIRRSGTRSFGGRFWGGWIHEVYQLFG